MSLRTLTLYHFMEHNARYSGDRPAAIEDETIVTHRQFLERVDRLAAGMLAQGLRKGERVCILAQNSIDYLVLYGACAKTGVIAYPINWRLTAEEVKNVIALAEPKMLAVGMGHLPQLEASDLSRVAVRVLLGSGEAAGYAPLGSLSAAPGEAGEVEAVEGDDPFVVISTAAVAGVPRGAVLTHNNLIFIGYQRIATLGLSSADRHLAALPLFHVTGLNMSLNMIQVGGANVVMERFDPAAASAAIDAHGVSLLADFPPVLAMLLGAREQGEHHWDSLRVVFGLDSPDTIKRLLTETKAKFWTGFGQSETSGGVTTVRVDLKPGATGQPLPMVRVRCVDEAGHDVPVGQPGEIVVQGPTVFAGYWRDEDATNFAFRHGWHHTGDVGKFDEAGYLYYVGRKPEKDLIKPGGENVYPAEVEHVLAQMPGVNAVCVIGVPDEKWGEAVKAVVELAKGQSATVEQVSEWVGERIARYKRPRVVEFVTALPRTASGEIDRLAVKTTYGGAAE